MCDHFDARSNYSGALDQDDYEFTELRTNCTDPDSMSSMRMGNLCEQDAVDP